MIPLSEASARQLCHLLDPYQVQGRQALQHLSQADLDGVRARCAADPLPRAFREHRELLGLFAVVSACGVWLAVAVLLELHVRHPALVLFILLAVSLSVGLTMGQLLFERVRRHRQLLGLLQPLAAYPSRLQAVLRDGQKSPAAQAYLTQVQARRELIQADDYVVFRLAVVSSKAPVVELNPASVTPSTGLAS